MPFLAAGPDMGWSGAPSAFGGPDKLTVGALAVVSEQAGSQRPVARITPRSKAFDTGRGGPR